MGEGPGKCRCRVGCGRAQTGAIVWYGQQRGGVRHRRALPSAAVVGRSPAALKTRHKAWPPPLPPLPGPVSCCRKVQDGCAMALQLEEDKHLILKLVQQQVGSRAAARAGGCQGRAGVVLRPSPPQWVRG